MKILCIANVRLPTERAYGVALMRQCEAFVETGHEVTLAYARRRNHLTGDPFTYYGIHTRWALRQIGVIEGVGWGKVGTALTILSFLPGALWRAWREKPDVIFTRDDFTGAFLCLFFKNVVWEVHTARSTPHLCFLRHRAHAVVYISGGLKEYYAQHCARPAKRELVAPSAISLAPFEAVTQSKGDLRKELDIPACRNVVGYVGKMTTMGEGKGVDTLIEAFSIVLRTVPDAYLLLVGAEEKDMALLSHECEKHAVPEAHFRVVPHVSQALVPRYLQSCDCLVLCYPNTEHYRLHMSPIKLFEYLASGVPVVSTDLPSVREVVGDEDVVFVPPSDAERLAEGMVQQMKKPITGSHPSANLKRYTWGERARRLSDML